MKKKIYIRSTAIDELLGGQSTVGGIAVQLYFWSQEFVSQGWTVYSLTKGKPHKDKGIQFLSYRNWGRIDIVHEWLHHIITYSVCRPGITMVRGAGRSLYSTAKISKLFRSKLVLFGASDVNFEPGKELISGNERNRKLYQKAIRDVDYFVVQNVYQQKTLQLNYHKSSIIMPNIWCDVTDRSNEKDVDSDVIWVANMRRLKRAEWVLHAAQRMPNVRFRMVGGPDSKEVRYYEEISQQASGIKNVVFMGKQPFFVTSEVVGCSKVLVCSSTFEGFPNTFLQAWSKGIPVISTVNPSEVITQHHLGIVVSSEDELTAALQHMLESEVVYRTYVDSVKQYFEQTYSAKSRLNELLIYLNR